MSFRTKKIILYTIGGVLITALFLFNGFLTESKLGIGLLVAALVGYVILSLIWWRCPHCGSYLGKLSPFATFCPHCGQELK